MRAIVVSAFGPPPVLVAAEVPESYVGAGQVLVDVAFANITFVDTQIRAGTAPFGRPTLPFVPGNGVGGTVREVGAGVDSAWLGRSVVSSTGGSGGYAEQVAVEAGNLIEVPASLGLAEAVALMADGRTALALREATAVSAGEWVLIEAAAGGVGTLLVQLCRELGARVVGVAGGAAKLRLVADLGADVTADYTLPNWAVSVREHTGGLDVVFDGVGGQVAADAFGLLRPGGRMVSYGLASGAFAAIGEQTATERGVRMLRGVPVAPERAVALSGMALQLAATGRLSPVIGQRYPLDLAAAAHAAIESRNTLGKTLLVVAPDSSASLPLGPPGHGL